MTSLQSLHSADDPWAPGGLADPLAGVVADMDVDLSIDPDVLLSPVAPLRRVFCHPRLTPAALIQPEGTEQ
jgi:hypothetical protein